MVAQRGTATTATSSNGTSVSATKPTGVVAGDVLIAAFTQNNQTVTAPSGWTLLFNQAASTGNSWATGVWYKVAGASEGSSYAFSVGSSAPLVLSLSAWSNVDAAPLDAQAHAASAGVAEPHTGPSVTAVAANGKTLYLRAVRFAGSTVPTFSTTSGSVAEVADVGIFSGGSVCYANAWYADTADFTSAGSKAGLSISCSQAESDNVEATVTLKSSTTPATGTFASTLPRVGPVDFEVGTHFDATVTSTLPHPLATSAIGLGQPIPVTSTMTASLPKLSPVAVTAAIVAFGTLAAPIVIATDIEVETRVFGIRVIVVDFDDSRTITIPSRSDND